MPAGRGTAACRRGGRRLRGRLQDDRHYCVEGCGIFCTLVGARTASICVLHRSNASNACEETRPAALKLGDVARAQESEVSLGFFLSASCLLCLFAGPCRVGRNPQTPFEPVACTASNQRWFTIWISTDAERLCEAWQPFTMHARHAASSRRDRRELGGRGASSDVRVSLDCCVGPAAPTSRRNEKHACRLGCINAPKHADLCARVTTRPWWTPSVESSPSSRTSADDRVQHAPYA